MERGDQKTLCYAFLLSFKEISSGCHRLLVEAYCNPTLAVQTIENWFRQFKSGDFDLENKERPGQLEKFKGLRTRGFSGPKPVCNA